MADRQIKDLSWSQRRIIGDRFTDTLKVKQHSNIKLKPGQMHTFRGNYASSRTGQNINDGSLRRKNLDHDTSARTSDEMCQQPIVRLIRISPGVYLWMPYHWMSSSSILIKPTVATTLPQPRWCLFSLVGDSTPGLTFIEKTKNYLTDLNLFPAVPPSTDPDWTANATNLNQSIYSLAQPSHWPFFLLYTSTVTIIKTVTVKRPTLNKFNDLYQQHPQTLTCPCTEDLDELPHLYSNQSNHAPSMH